VRRLGLDSGPRFPASLQLASLLKAIAWIVSVLAGLLLLLALLGASVAPIGLAIGIPIACYAIFNHLVLYAAAEGLIIAVAVEQNTRLTATLLSQANEGLPSHLQRQLGELVHPAANRQDSGPVEEALHALESDSAYERELAAESLGLLGAQATKAIPALEVAASDPDGRVRSRAQWAIGEIRRGR
jgi:hypothetical protein